MWMAELATRSGLSVATIKYYLREGLLPAGVATGATRAVYDESHVHRLRLIRALTDVAGMSLETVREVLAGITGADTQHDAVGSAHTRLGTHPGQTASAESLQAVDDFLARHGWELGGDRPQRTVLAHALETLAALDFPLDIAILDGYAEAMAAVAAAEVASVLTEDREESAERAVIGTVLQEPVLLAIRRIAQENASRQLAGPAPSDAG